MLRDFLGSFGLDGGVKARCYVEGQTELGALRYVLGPTSQCVVVNLSGAVEGSPSLNLWLLTKPVALSASSCSTPI